MFNNPFREQAIAASANRQHLDRLLRVTAPRERIALAVVGLILVGVCAWIVFGEVDRAVERDCVLLGSGPEYGATALEPGYQATLFAAPRVARLLQPGMTASVEVKLPDGATRRLEGSVSAITANWSTVGDSEERAITAATDSTRRIDINLPPAPDLDLTDLTDGVPCRARIVHGRYSPATLLGFG